MEKLQDLRNTPICTDKNSWLFEHKGRISVGLLLPDEPSMLSIIAYSDDIKDAPTLRKIAKDTNGIIVKNYMEEGVYAID